MKLVNKALKGALKYGLTWFVAIYMGIGGYAALDYKLSHSKKIEEKTKNTLVIQKYNVPLEDRIKELTIVGETHLYNSKETEFAKDFIDNYQHVARESNPKEPSDPLLTITALGSIPAFLFYSMGTGRSLFNPTLASLAKQKGKTVYFLEEGEDEFNKRATLGQRFAQVGYAIFGLAVAPVAYFEGKRELEGNHTKKNEELTNYLYNMDERDGIMAKNILKILEKDEVDSLLCVVGKAHARGIVKRLEGKVNIERLYD